MVMIVVIIVMPMAMMRVMVVVMMVVVQVMMMKVVVQHGHVCKRVNGVNRGRRLEVAFVPVTTTRCPEYHLPSVPPHLPRTGRADEPANVSLRRMVSYIHSHPLTHTHSPLSTGLSAIILTWQ